MANGFRAYVEFVESDSEGFPDPVQRHVSPGRRMGDPSPPRWSSRSPPESPTSLTSLICSAPHRLALAHGILGLAEGMMRYWQSGQPHHHLDRDDLLADLVTLAWRGLRGLE